MKKLLLIMACLLSGVVAQAQGDFTVGVNAGIPVGDLEEASSFQLGADIAYLFGQESFNIGPMVGVSHFFGKDEIEDFTFLPIAASGRLYVSGSFYLGADLGYALGISEGNDGGFYYRPKVGYNLGGLALNLSYSGVSLDGGSANSLNLGLEFGL